MSNRNERDFDEQQYAQRNRPESQGFEQQMREREGRDRDIQGSAGSRNDRPGYYTPGYGQQPQGGFGGRGYEAEPHGYSESHLWPGYGAQGSVPESHGMQQAYGRPGWSGQAYEGGDQSAEFGAQGYGARQEQPGYGYPGASQLGVSRRFGPQPPYGAQGPFTAPRYPYGEPLARSQYGGRESSMQQWGGRQQWHAPGEERFGEQPFAQQYGQQLHGPQGPAQPYAQTLYGQPGYAPGLRSSHRGLGPKNYSRPDERIREDINERLTDADDIDARGLTVEVNNGVATLSGTVEQRWMKHRAEDIAEGCSGVRDVHNQIRVQQPQESTGSTLGSRASGANLGASGGSAAGASTQGSSTTTTSAGSGSSSTRSGH